jgi:hypothetical protein
MGPLMGCTGAGGSRTRIRRRCEYNYRPTDQNERESDYIELFHGTSSIFLCDPYRPSMPLMLTRDKSPEPVKRLQGVENFYFGSWKSLLLACFFSPCNLFRIRYDVMKIVDMQEKAKILGTGM